MTNEKKLPSDLDYELREYIKSSHEYVENFDYSISDDGKQITLSGNPGNVDRNELLECVYHVEKMLNISFENVSIINGRCRFIFNFNEDEN